MLIVAGMVTVNGKVVRKLGIKVDPDQDRIQVNGKIVKNRQPKVYVILNKPKGYISTLKDPQKRPIVIDLIKDRRRRIFPVGRLDRDTEGLLLLTNDGDLTQRLLHPSKKVLKTYLFGINGTLNPHEISELESGVELDDGLTAPARLRLIKRSKKRSWWEISIYEGRKRQVRRMLQSVGHPIFELKRIRFGSLELGTLTCGKYRFLSDREVRHLKQTVS